MSNPLTFRAANRTGAVIPAGTAVNLYEVPGMNPSTIKPAVAGVTPTSGPIAQAFGFTMEPVNNNFQGTVLRAGPLDGFVDLHPGNYYYLDPAVPGGITLVPTNTPGQVAQVVGFAVSPTILFIEISQGIWQA